MHQRPSNLKFDNMNSCKSSLNSPYISLSSVIKSDWKWWLFGAFFSFMLASFLVSGWPAGLFPNFDYPYVYKGDGLSMAMEIQRVVEGWIFENSRSGYPFGSDFYDYFPGVDSGSFLVFKLIGWLTTKWQTILNLYFLLGFAVTFVTAFCVLRTLGLAIPFAFTASILFDFLPFHFQRIQHLFYTWYFIVPVFYYIALKLYNSNLKIDIAQVSARKKIFYTVYLLSLGLFGVYYAVFGLIVLFVIVMATMGNRNLNSLRLTLCVSCIVIFCVLLNLIPSLIYNHSNGHNSEVAQRGIAESEIYALKFAQMVLPRQEHRNATFRRISEQYLSNTQFNNENVTVTLGIIGSLGLLAVLCIIFFSLTGRPQNSTLSITSLIVLVLFMFGTIGGFGSIFALVISPMIRGWNRISIFISFGTLLVFFFLLQDQLNKYFMEKRFRIISSILLTVILLGGLYDQTVPACESCNENIKKSFNMDKEFVHSIEKSLPVGSAVYQLPYMSFPEVPPLHFLQTYELSAGFLHSSLLHWSYGGIKGRSGDLFYRSLEKEPLKKQLEVIKRLGFTGIYVDRRGFADNAHNTIDELIALVGAPPTLMRSDGAVVFFRLNQDESNISLDGLSNEQIMNKANYIVDSLGIRYEATLAEGIDFTRPEFPSFVKDVQGLSGSEAWGRWTDATVGPVLKFTFKQTLPRKFTLEITGSAYGPNVGLPVKVRVGAVEKTFIIPPNKGVDTYRLTFETDGTADTIEIIPPNPARPQDIIPGNDDSRLLGLGLVSIKIK